MPVPTLFPTTIRLLLAFILLPPLAGCAPALLATGGTVSVLSLLDRRTIGTQADDESSEWKMIGRIPEKYQQIAHINATAYNRRLLLTGEVPDSETKQIIGEIATGIEGVRQVYNELTVAPVSSLAARSADTLTDSKVKARLIEDKQISANHIKVVTERGVTYLMGIVNEREARIATRIASTTDGVRSVVSLLERISDGELKRLTQAPSTTNNDPR